MERIDADLPLRLFDLSSSHTKALATLFAGIGQAQRKITSRLDTTYKTAVATDVAVTAIEVATAIGAVKATAVGVAKSAIRKGFTRQAAVRLAQKHALKQLAAAATVYTTVGLGLPPLLASSGLSQQFIFTGLMLMQGLGMLQALRAVGLENGISVKPKGKTAKVTGATDRAHAFGNNAGKQGDALGAIRDIAAHKLFATHTIRGASSRKTASYWIQQFERAKGWTGDPVAVFESKGYRYILDGHHRVAAARAAQIPVQYC